MSVARVARSGGRSVVQLREGALVYSTEPASEPLVIFAADVMLQPSTAEPGSGRIAQGSICAIYISVAKGSLGVTSRNETRTVSANQDYVVRLQSGVAFTDAASRQSIPDWSDPQFHGNHKHVACGMAGSPRHPGTTAPSDYGIAAGIGITTTIVLIKALESPDGP